MSGETVATLEQLLILVARAERHRLTPQEARVLREGIRRLAEGGDLR